MLTPPQQEDARAALRALKLAFGPADAAAGSQDALQAADRLMARLPAGAAKDTLRQLRQATEVAARDRDAMNSAMQRVWPRRPGKAPPEDEAALQAASHRSARSGGAVLFCQAAAESWIRGVPPDESCEHAVSRARKVPEGVAAMPEHD